MNSAAQIDLARDEATPAQVLASPLGDVASTIGGGTRTTLTPAPAAEATTIDSVRRSMRGGVVSSTSVRLKPRSPARPQHGQAVHAQDTGFTPKAFGETDNAFELQPIDKGFGAWSYVAATFAMYIVVWGEKPFRKNFAFELTSPGFPYAFPIFQTHLSNGADARYPDSAVLRLLAPGIQDILEGILFPLLPPSSGHRRALVLVGITIIMISLILASYATDAWQIVLTQGVTFGIGGILLNFVHVSIFPEWFDKKKGQAMGIIWTGWRVGALAFPPICQWLLDSHGFANTIRVLLPPMLTLLAPAIVLLRGRYHQTVISKPQQTRTVSKSQALRAPAVLYYLAATNLYFLIVNVPKMFISTFAADLHFSGNVQAAALTVLTLSEMAVTYVCGWLSDSHDYGIMLGVLAFLTGIIHVLGLGLSKSKVALFLYAISVGIASGGEALLLIEKTRSC